MGGTLAVIVTRQFAVVTAAAAAAATLDRSTGAFLSAERTIVRARRASTTAADAVK